MKEKVKEYILSLNTEFTTYDITRMFKTLDVKEKREIFEAIDELFDEGVIIHKQIGNIWVYEVVEHKLKLKQGGK